jgi:hypothetical protein
MFKVRFPEKQTLVFSGNSFGTTTTADMNFCGEYMATNIENVGEYSNLTIYLGNMSFIEIFLVPNETFEVLS